MPFSSLKDPVDVARAQAALDIAWERLKAGNPNIKDQDAARTRLAYLVANLVDIAADEAELAERALAKFESAGAI